MNLCIISGRIVRNATVKGNGRRVLRFTVETRDGHQEAETQERINQVPCVMFGPAPELESLLTSQGEGQTVELQGRVASWGGETNSRANAEVVVFNRSLTFTKD